MSRIHVQIKRMVAKFLRHSMTQKMIRKELLRDFPVGHTMPDSEFDVIPKEIN